MSSSGAVTTMSTLTANTCTVSDTGCYTLKVNSIPVNPSTPRHLSRTSVVTTAATSSSFQSGLRTFANMWGPVTFTSTSSSVDPALAEEQIFTTAVLAVCRYTISGNDLNANDDSVTWPFSLTVRRSIAHTSSTSGVSWKIPLALRTTLETSEESKLHRFAQNQEQI